MRVRGESEVASRYAVDEVSDMEKTKHFLHLSSCGYQLPQLPGKGEGPTHSHPHINRTWGRG